MYRFTAMQVQTESLARAAQVLNHSACHAGELDKNRNLIRTISGAISLSVQLQVVKAWLFQLLRPCEELAKRERHGEKEKEKERWTTRRERETERKNYK